MGHLENISKLVLCFVRPSFCLTLFPLLCPSFSPPPGSQNTSSKFQFTMPSAFMQKLQVNGSTMVQYSTTASQPGLASAAQPSWGMLSSTSPSAQLSQYQYQYPQPGGFGVSSSLTSMNFPLGKSQGGVFSTPAPVAPSSYLLSSNKGYLPRRLSRSMLRRWGATLQARAMPTNLSSTPFITLLAALCQRPVALKCSTGCLRSG